LERIGPTKNFLTGKKKSEAGGEGENKKASRRNIDLAVARTTMELGKVYYSKKTFHSTWGRKGRGRKAAGEPLRKRLGECPDGYAEGED